MKKSWMAVIVPGLLLLLAAVFILSLLLVKVLWAWTIPDIFPGAVEQGLIARSITWGAAAKLAIFVAVLAGFGKAAA